MTELSQTTKDRIDGVIRSIRGEIAETEEIGFNMEYGISSALGAVDYSDRACGTVACIAGHALAVSRKDDQDDLDRFGWFSISMIAREYLDIPKADANELFLANNYIENNDNVDLDTITPEHAIRTLVHLRDNGVVDWKATE